MRHATLMLAMLLSLAALSAVDYVTIHDIQYTTNPGCEGTYPSPYCGEKVRTSGVITAVNKNAGLAYVSSTQGGEWNSICVKAGQFIASKRLRVGVIAEFTGRVAEQFGMTILVEVSDVQTKGMQNILPETAVSTGAIRNEEGYESALVRLQNVSLVDFNDGAWKIDDGSGVCIMEDGFDNLNADRLSFDTEGVWREARGVVTFRFGEYRLNPRTSLDLGGQNGLNVNHTSWGRVKSLYR